MNLTISEELIELANILRYFKMYHISNLLIKVAVGLQVRGVTNEEELDKWKEHQ